MIRTLKDSLFDYPQLFNFARSLLEGGNKEQFRLLRQQLSPTDNILDIGCGTGYFSVLSQHYHGIDITPSFISYARKKYSKPFDLMDATKLTFKNKSFDTVLLLSILHHLPDELLVKVLKEAARVGKKLLVIDLIQKNNLLSRLLYNLDRGHNIRTMEEQQRLISTSFKITHASVFDASALYRHSFIIAVPKH